MAQLQSLNPPNFNPTSNAPPTIPSTSSAPKETMSGASMTSNEPKLLDENQKTIQGSLNFNPNGRVQAIDAVGNKYDFSPKEYSAILGKEGLRSPQVEAYLKNQQERAIMGQSARETLNASLKQKGAQSVLAPIEQAKRDQAILQVDEQNAQQQILNQQKENQPLTFKENMQRFNEATNLANFSLKFTAKAYDFVTSAFYGGKGIEQREAENTIAQVEGDLTRDIDLVNQGLKPAEEVQQNIKLLEQATIRLENSVRGFNKYNLGYFIKDGKDVQTRVKLARDNIQDYKMSLRQAQINAIAKGIV